MNKIVITFYSIILTLNIIAQGVIKPEGTLPVELVYFVGDVVDSTVELRWGTATEVNNYGYDILRADTSLLFERIDFVQGHGNSYSPKDYLFFDTTITKNGKYFYLLKQIDFDGNFELTHDTVKVTVDYITSIKENFQTQNLEPEVFELSQNYPNPFNPETNILFTIREQDFVTLKLYSITGEELETIISGIVTSGTHIIKFKPKNLSSGTYIYKFSVHNKSVSKKMIFIK
ncbi:MAG: T9SS type A sorting domain-containing protein [Bacteroidetes bacterium]|nr:T9SS type A sorting domain-containing protein [Bacteroidota bacterium]MBU1114777.1 T9SS type A sorting domain-containing protein [Bacteroidota bacterium]MBU1799068.1 T9SS type A sorting domain-containing protein [Bacteroidota bacterium]